MEILRVSGDNARRPGELPGFVKDCILEIRDLAVQSALNHEAVDRSHFEQAEQLPQGLPCIFFGKSLTEESVDGCDGSGTEHAADFGPLCKAEYLRCGCGKRSALEEDIENDVGVQNDFHRCLSLRCRL